MCVMIPSFLAACIFSDSCNQAVSVSLPTWRANVGYEMGEAWVIDNLQSGYPRSV